MSTASDLLARYAAHHRDERNIATHFVGVPMIVFAIGVLLHRPAVAVEGLAITPAWLLFGGSVVWYLSRGSVVLGATACAGIGALVLLAQRVGDGLGNWLAWGLGFLTLGWLLRSLGHWYEGRKPAVAEDLSSLMVAPLFVAAEALFSLGWNKPMAVEIERRAGPKHVRDMAQMA